MSIVRRSPSPSPRGPMLRKNLPGPAAEFHGGAPRPPGPQPIRTALPSLLLVALSMTSARSTTAAPASVTIAGTFQTDVGCGRTWDPACAITHLAYDAEDDVWQGTWNISGGTYEYKAALNDSWGLNYGRYALQNGPNIPLTVGGTRRPVKFYYDDKTHWVTDQINSVIATAVGTFQTELGCASDWDPRCLRSWLEDTNGDGVYTFSTSAIPAGSYEAKVMINESASVTYGQGGALNGASIPFAVPANGTPLLFVYDSVSHLLTIYGSAPVAARTTSWGGVKILYR